MNTIALGLSFLSTKMTEGMSYLSKSTTHFTTRKAVVAGIIAAATITALSMSSHTMDLPCIDKAGITLLATTACSSLYFTAARRIERYSEDRSFQKFLSTCLEKSNDKSIRIENIATMSEEERKQLALLCAKTNALDTVKYFKNFGLTREEDIKEVALLCAKTDTWGTPIYFKNFGLTRQEDIKEIALLCAKTNAWNTAIHFENFGLTRQEDIKEIALFCAKIDAFRTAICFKNFGLTRQEDIKEIALLSAQDNATGTAELFKNFGLTREEDIKEVALLCVKTGEAETAQYFQNFGITNQEHIKEIALIYFLRSPNYADKYFDNFTIKDQVFIRRLRLLGLILDCSALSPERRNTLPLQADQDLTTLGFSADSEVTSYLQQERGRLFPLDLNSPSALRYYQHLCMAELLKSSAGKEGIQPFIESALINIFNLRDKTLISNLFFTLYQTNGCSLPPLLLSQQKADTMYKSFIELSTEGPDLRKYTVVIALTFIEGSSQLKEEVRTRFIKGMKDILPKLRLTLKDGRKKLDVQYARTLLALQKTLLSQEQIFTLIETQDRTTTSQEFATIFSKRLQHLNVLALTGFFDKGLPEGLTDIESAYSTCVQHAFFGEGVLSEVNQVEFEKNRSKLQIPRHPAALELYALNLKKLNNEALNAEMQRFVWNLLRGSFRQARYSGSSEHMDTFRKDFPALWEQWQTLPKSIPLEPDAAALTIKPCYAEENSTWLTQTSGEGHGGDTLRTIADRIRQKETLTSPIEKLCAALCQQPISLDQTKEVLNKLQHAVAADSKLKKCQWLQDIRDRLTLLSPKQQEGHLEVMISDTWEDLFLSGTDVLGSCQRIDGSPGYNKCLLGYCMDGKIQMAVVKEKETGKIVSRAILKLLLTSNKEGHLVPALFLEKIYPSPCSPEHTKALEKIAQERAKDLGVPLYTKMEGGAATEAVTLCSLGSPSPFEYEDGGAGIADGGKYEIKGKVFL